MKHVFDKYIFPVATAFLTYTAITLIIALFGASATPLTAFLAIIVSFIALSGILVVRYNIKG